MGAFASSAFQNSAFQTDAVTPRGRHRRRRVRPDHDDGFLRRLVEWLLLD